MDRKEKGRLKRHGRIRKRIFGTSERPRVAVHRSSKNLYVQVIDDVAQATLLSFSTADKAFEGASEKGKVAAASQLGKTYAPKLKEKGIEKIAFDRGGYLYHGRVKALADGLREGGLQF